MPIAYNLGIKRPYYAGHKSSYLDIIPEEDLLIFSRLEDIDATAGEIKVTPKIYDRPDMTSETDEMAAAKMAELQLPRNDTNKHGRSNSDTSRVDEDYLTSGGGSWSGASTPGTPGSSRSNIQDNNYGNFETFDREFPSVDRVTILDILENLALPQRLERMQNAIHDNAERLRRQRQRLATRAKSGKDNLVEEWRKRVTVTPEEQLEKYRRRIRLSVDRLNKRWNDSKTVSLMEKVSFTTSVLNIFASGYLIGSCPEYFHYWYTAQLLYYMPIRWYKYHKVGFHYFLADLCYFVNLLLLLSIWFFPQSKRLFISTFCLAFGNNAVAIAMWRNSLVFHSLDKVTSLFIHIMPCATLHVMVHNLSEEMQLEKFPAVHTIKYSTPDAPEHYTLRDMIVWATLPYAVWQLSYHFLITIRKRAKIAAGRPTSFTWLRKSYRGNILGKFVLSFPESMQEVVFMFIQYTYALLTMLPCPLWFWYRWASATFLTAVLSWASWNGANYYIEVFGKRMEKELEQLRKEVARMSKSPDINGQDGLAMSPTASPVGPTGTDSGAAGQSSALDLGPPADSSTPQTEAEDISCRHRTSVDAIAPLDATTVATGSEVIEPGTNVERTLDNSTEAVQDARAVPAKEDKKNA